MPGMSIVKRRLAIVRSASSSIVKTRYIGESGVTSRMIARTPGASRSARADFTT